MVGFTLQAARTAHDLFAPKLAQRGALATRGRLVGHIVVNIARDKEVKTAIAIVISPGSAGGPVSQRHSRLLRHIGESAIVVIVIKPVLSEVADIDIGPAIIVVIGDGNTNAPPLIGHACLCSNVGKRAVVVIVKESSLRPACFSAYSVDSRAVDQVNIQP